MKNSFLLGSIVLLFTINCFKKINSFDKIECKNDAFLYKPLNNNNLLFVDSTNTIYLRVDNTILNDSNIPLSDCQKLPFVFINEMALANDSIVDIGSIVKSETFTRIKKTTNYFIDKNRIYYYKNDIATYPNFFELYLNKSDFKVIDSVTISDGQNTYVKGLLKHK